MPVGGTCLVFGEPRRIGVGVEQLVCEGDEPIRALVCGFGRTTW
jgi:hypothetical protein